MYSNFDDPGASSHFQNLAKSLGGADRTGPMGGEARPSVGAGVGPIMANVGDALANGRTTPQRYRKSAVKELTKGFGARVDPATHMVGYGPYEDWKARSEYAEEMLMGVTRKGFKSLGQSDRITKSFAGPLASWVNGVNRFSPQALAGAMWSKNLDQALGKAIGKSFSVTSPLASGFVPFDLVPFVRTLYPVRTPFRNKIPRTPGQGEYHRGKYLATVSGALPGGLGALQDDSTTEFFGGAGFGSWPNPLPASGAQTAYDMTIPYKFFALTEATSWLAQFEAQGFDDLYGLASLVLLQEFMLLEEHDLIASSSQSLAQPLAPTCTVRAAQSNETALTFTGTDLWVTVTAINYWGETGFGTTLNVTEVTGATSGTSVVDVTISTVPGTLMYRIYVGTGTAAPGRAGFWLWATNTQVSSAIGGVKFTLQGAVPTSGTNPPAADTGTGSTNRQESFLSVLSGLAYNGGLGPYPNIAAGYYNAAVAAQLTVQTVTNALQQAYNGSTGYLADPSDLIASPTDAKILADSIRNETVAAFQFRVQQSEMAGITAGVAVSGIVNPITRSVPDILVHPYLTQGTFMGLSYTLPDTQNNLGNVVEIPCVQDYATIGWPVIDATFRQSILRLCTFYMPAPQYCLLLGGLQSSATTPFS
jgi:hypothetical protein